MNISDIEKTNKIWRSILSKGCKLIKTASVCSIDFLHIPGSARGETGIWLTILRQLVELPDWCFMCIYTELISRIFFFFRNKLELIQ